MFKKWYCLLLLPFVLCSSCFSIKIFAAAPAIKYAVPEANTGYVAKLDLHSPAEVEQMLRRAEVFVENLEQYPDFEPITVILHGPELKAFDRRNYKDYKEIVGLAARLVGFNIIIVQACEEQMKRDGILQSNLPAFVETVPYGPAEEKRLLKRGYQYF